MKILKTKIFEKMAYPSYDDQPGYVDRDVSGEGASIYIDQTEMSDEEQVKNNWKKKKKQEL